jgi:acyl-CoA reductase-like NAD-dependent aldehyde dehydrogenase
MSAAADIQVDYNCARCGMRKAVGVQQIWINGAWVDAVSTVSREIKNPATLEPLGTVPECGAEDVGRAVGAAKAAQREWWKIPAGEKGMLLREVGTRIRARADALARLMTLESGNPLCESLDCVAWAAACFDQHAEIAGSSDDKSARAGLVQHRHAFNGSEPSGVIAAITSFSFPLKWMAAHVAPAIAAGNAVVCKPPQQNPLASLMLAETCGLLPPGVVNVVTGGADTGKALVDHPDVGLITFAGPASAGRQIAAAAGTGLKKVAFELCSVDPIILLGDADLDVAVPGIAWARLRHSGQDCTSSKPIYVERSVAAQFADRIHEYMAYLEVGDPIKPETDLGPLISLAAARRVEEQVAHAAKNGARLKFGGRCFRPWGLPGHFFQPTILTDVRPGSAAIRDEMLGPVLSITPVADLEEAIRFAKDQGCGTRTSIYTATPELATRARESLRGGTFSINDAVDGDAARLGGMRKPWWFPYRDRKSDLGCGMNFDA